MASGGGAAELYVRLTEFLLGSGEMSPRRASDFSVRVKLLLAQRVGYACSFPNCSRPTIGPAISDSQGVITVGRACHIEAASRNGPRFNVRMTPSQRSGIENGIWCCNIHADIIDRDRGAFSVATLHEWKRIAELNAFDRIDSSHAAILRPSTLVQLSDNIVFEAVWRTMDVESSTMTFALLQFVYGDISRLTRFLESYPRIPEAQRYVVVESSGYGRQLVQAPTVDTVGEVTVVGFCTMDRTEYENPNRMVDARLVFTDAGTDLDLRTNNGWITGKDAVIQAVQMLLGSNRGQWALDPSFGSYLFRYYKDHHSNHELLQRLIKLDVSRMTSVPDPDSLSHTGSSIPVSTIKWVEGVRIVGHSDNLLQIELRLYFSDDTYFSGTVSVPASIEQHPRST